MDITMKTRAKMTLSDPITECGICQHSSSGKSTTRSSSGEITSAVVLVEEEDEAANDDDEEEKEDDENEEYLRQERPTRKTSSTEMKNTPIIKPITIRTPFIGHSQTKVLVFTKR